MDRLLTTQEAAEVAGVGTTAIKRWADSGLLTCVRTAGGHRRFSETALNAFLRERRYEVRTEAPEKCEADDWTKALVHEGGVYEIASRLLKQRGRQGAWYRVAAFLGTVLDTIGERWEEGSISILEEHLASDRLRRAITYVSEGIPLADNAPYALLACAEGDDHTLGLSLVELCCREAGWNTRWAGRASPAEELVALIDEGVVDLVGLSASSFSGSRAKLARWSTPIARTAESRDIPILFGGEGAWPEPTYGSRLRSFDELHAFLSGHDATRRKSRFSG